MGSRPQIELIFYVAGSFYASVFMSIFLRPKWRKKMRSLEANGGRLRPFEAKVKLWVSKFIFFHADSGNGLKHFLNKKVFGLGKRAFGGLSWPLLKCSFQDTY